MTSTAAGSWMSAAVTTPGPVLDQHDLVIVGLAVKDEDDLLEVEDDVGDVFLDVGHRRELVLDPGYLDRGDGSALERGQQHAPQGVAEGVPKAAGQRLHDEAAPVLTDRFIRTMRGGEV